MNIRTTVGTDKTHYHMFTAPLSHIHENTCSYMKTVRKC